MKHMRLCRASKMQGATKTFTSRSINTLHTPILLPSSKAADVGWASTGSMEGPKGAGVLPMSQDMGPVMPMLNRYSPGRVVSLGSHWKGISVFLRKKNVFCLKKKKKKKHFFWKKTLLKKKQGSKCFFFSKPPVLKANIHNLSQFVNHTVTLVQNKNNNKRISLKWGLCG